MRRWLLPWLACLLGFGAPAAPAAPERFDLKAVQALARRWFEARPPTRFGEWDPARRRALLEEARALGPLPEGRLEAIVEVLRKEARRHVPRATGTLDTPYGPATWIQRGRGGPKEGLVLGLHGGGEGAGNASEAAGNWTPARHLCFYPQGIRLVHDTWNSVHGERFLLTLIEVAKVHHDIDPDRVYAVGFSMGGTGSMFLAGRHPDLLAGAIPAHGVIAARGGSKVVDEAEVGDLEHGLLPNLRHVALWFYTGELDRNCEPGTFKKAWTVLQGLRAAGDGGYDRIRFHLDPERAHAFPPGEPAKGLQWVLAERRVTHPRRLTWEVNDAPWPWPDDADQGKARRFVKRWFYWLHCAHPSDRLRVEASIAEEEGRTVVRIDAPGAFREDFTVYLCPELADPAREVEVRFGGEVAWRGRPGPDLVSVFESYDARLDRRLVYDRRIVLPE